MPKKKIELSKDEVEYLGVLLDSEVFKLKGVFRVVKKPPIQHSLKNAEEIKRKVDSISFA